MSVEGAKEKIHQVMMQCDGVTSAVHRFGWNRIQIG
jgi:hypothetical protein